MKLVSLIRKLAAVVIGFNGTSASKSINVLDINYILALSPISSINNSNYAGLVIIVMLIAIVILIGYTLFNNKNK